MEHRLGILGGLGRPTRLAPCGDPNDFICSWRVNRHGIKVLSCGPKHLARRTCGAGPMPVFRKVVVL